MRDQSSLSAANATADPNPTLTALKNAYQTAKTGIQTLAVGNDTATGAPSSSSADDAEFALAYLAADSAAAAAAMALPQGLGAEEEEVEDANGLGEKRDDIAVWLGKFLTPLRFRFTTPVLVQGIELRCVMFPCLFRGLDLSSGGFDLVGCLCASIRATPLLLISSSKRRQAVRPLPRHLQPQAE